MPKRKGAGWSVLILECADGSYYTDMSSNVGKTLGQINQRQGVYFSKHPERVPVKVVFEEKQLDFVEAYRKFRYLRQMNRKLRKKLIETRKWPLGKPLREYLQNKDEDKC